MPESMATCVIRVNKQEIRVDEGLLQGRRVLELAGLDPDGYDLFKISGQDSKKLALDATVSIVDGMQCNAILKSVPYG